MITEATTITSPPEALYIDLCRVSGEIEIAREASQEFSTFIFHKVENIEALREHTKLLCQLLRMQP